MLDSSVCSLCCAAPIEASLALRNTQCPSEGKVFQVFLDPPRCHHVLSCTVWILMFALLLACLCFCTGSGSANFFLLITHFVCSDFTFSSCPWMWQFGGSLGGWIALYLSVCKSPSQIRKLETVVQLHCHFLDPQFTAAALFLRHLFVKKTPLDLNPSLY